MSEIFVEMMNENVQLSESAIFLSNSQLLIIYKQLKLQNKLS